MSAGGSGAMRLLIVVIVMLEKRDISASPQPPPEGPPPQHAGGPPGGPAGIPSVIEGFQGQEFEGLLTATLPAESLTDMPEYLVREAMQVDTGKYRNTRFHYQNYQDMDMWETPRAQGLIHRHTCLRQFLACTLSQSAPEPVCAYNGAEKNMFWTSDSYCHVFFDNCRRRFRVWRVLDTGVCQFHYQSSYDHVAKDIGYKPTYEGYHRVRRTGSISRDSRADREQRAEPKATS